MKFQKKTKLWSDTLNDEKINNFILGFTASFTYVNSFAPKGKREITAAEVLRLSIVVDMLCCSLNDGAHDFSLHSIWYLFWIIVK